MIDTGTSAPCRYIITSPREDVFFDRLGRSNSTLVRTDEDLLLATDLADHDTIWIVTQAAWVKRLVDLMPPNEPPFDPDRKLGHALLLEPELGAAYRMWLHDRFAQVAGDQDGFAWLPDDELAEAIQSDGRRDLFLGGLIDKTAGMLVLLRGDLDVLYTRLSSIPQDGLIKPDIEDFGLGDYGYSVKFGAFEVSAHAILFREDSDYRRRYNNMRPPGESGLGAALKRLRIAKRITHEDFPGIPAERIKQIEQGASGDLDDDTLRRLAERLHIPPEDLAGY